MAVGSDSGDLRDLGGKQIPPVTVQPSHITCTLLNTDSYRALQYLLSCVRLVGV